MDRVHGAQRGAGHLRIRHSYAKGLFHTDDEFERVDWNRARDRPREERYVIADLLRIT